MALTAEQRRAVGDRGRSSLLAAGAGSGKTAVMVERFCEAVCRDGVAVGAVLALTFTEKAAGELRERIRRRFVERGEDEHARSVDAAWVGTIHGFCAGVLRAQALAAGLDPRFTVLDEGAARRLATEAFERALDAWAAEHGTPALDLAATYAHDLEAMIVGAHAELRSRGHAVPRLAVPPPAADPSTAPGRGAAAADSPVPSTAAARDAATADSPVRSTAAVPDAAMADSPVPSTTAARDAATAAAAALRAAPGNGTKVAAALDALAACERLLAREGSVPLPADLDAARMPTGGRALEHDACAAYREAWTALRAACADHHARPALVLLDRLLAAFGAAYASAKEERAGVDFEDLELRVRDLLHGDPALRERWAARFALIMIDEFQDTNRLQLDVLEALERDNLFAVGDEAQSIYGFRHADVEIFRARRAALDGDAVTSLTVNFRSRPEILDTLNGAFAPVLGPGFTPLKAGRAGGELRLFEPGPAVQPHVELLVCDTAGWEEREGELGLATLAKQPWRRAEARAVAHRLRAEVDGGRRARDLVVLLRATSSLRLYEQALEEQGLPTYVIGGRGYWSQEQVRDGLAYLAVLANPCDETALHATLASPFCGVGADALVLLAGAGREEGGGAWAALRRFAAPASVATPPADGSWTAALAPDEAARLRRFAAFAAAERARAERLPVEVLLERAIAGTGYDLAILARAGGERRLANLRKLMRLAREYERAEGRDLRGFLAYAAGQDLAEAREGEAALESEALDAVRLMTIHRAKGLEFPVVCVADLGRPGQAGRPRLLLAPDGSAGLRFATTAGGEPVPALGYEAIAAALAEEEAEEERRLLYVAATRAEERLILSGGTDITRRSEPRPGGPPLDWLAPALLHDPQRTLAALADGASPGNADGDEPTATVECGDGRVAVRLITPATLAEAALKPVPRQRSGAPGTVLPAEARVVPLPARPQPAQRRLSYSSLQDYGRCGYRFYLQRVLGLPPVAPPPPDEPSQGAAGDEADEAAAPIAPGAPAGDAPAAAEEPAALDPRVRGTLVHALLERLDLARPVTPPAPDIVELGAAHGVALDAAQVADLAAQVDAFAQSPLRARLAAARHVRREAAFAFALEADGGGPLVSGFVDVLAREPDGGVLVVDYKTDRLGDADPEALVERDYATQRVVYALAALRDGAPRVEVAHCFLERPDDVAAATFCPEDAPALADRLSRLAAGVLAEAWPVTDRPHRELCADCPGRRSLCSWPEPVTLRPYDSAGTLAGSGGPS